MTQNNEKKKLEDEKESLKTSTSSGYKKLLISSPVSISEDTKISSSAMLLLWLVINHRRFLRSLPQSATCWKSTIHDKLVDADCLENYRKLRSTCK